MRHRGSEMLRVDLASIYGGHGRDRLIQSKPRRSCAQIRIMHDFDICFPRSILTNGSAMLGASRGMSRDARRGMILLLCCGEVFVQT